MLANLAIVPSPAIVVSPPTPYRVEDELPPEEWRGQHQGFSREGYEYCPILPWYNEVVTRMHEAQAVGSHIVNLSYTHPRGYIPALILRRKEVAAVLKGWMVDNQRSVPMPAPNSYYLPRGSKDLDYCDLELFLKEIDRREKEAAAEAKQLGAQDGQKHIPIIDLTPFHPRGGIPDVIMQRLARRKSRDWRAHMLEDIDKMTGEANKAESFAKTQEERAHSMADDKKDPKPLLAAAQELRERAEQLRENVKWMRKELGDGSR